MKNPKAISLIDHLNQEYKKLLGVENDLHFKRPDLISPLNESDKIPLSDRQYLVSYSTPGHTRCSFSFMLYPEMVLFTGDAAGVMEKNGTVRPLFLSSYKYYIDSLQKLETLPAEYLALPHNKPLRGREAIKDFFERSIDTTIALKERILRELQRGGKIEKIAEELFREFYAQSTLSGPKEAFMINLQAMVKAVSNEFLA
jgi:glyoxylase-like metal-dependent hydrolase (beta-lactamase superfamily II)